MSDVEWSGIRPDAKLVEVYNEALLVFLFDEQHLEQIHAAEADLEAGYFGDDANQSEPLAAMADRGILVAYELDQDDQIGVEVVVGPPLNEEELANGRWLKPQTAWLHLPSGVLRIETANTLFSDDEPGSVQVPAGDYHVTLYRLDWDALEEEGILNGDEPWPGPQEILVLTLSTAEQERGKHVALLPFPR